MEYRDRREERVIEDGDGRGEAAWVVGITEGQSTDGRPEALQILNRVRGGGWRGRWALSRGG